MNFDANGPIINSLRLQLSAVKQHFIHVLILQARSDEESAAGITKIDSVDLPCAMQLVDLLISTKSDFELCSNTAHLLQSLPNPGFTNTEIRLAEQMLETELGQALLEAKSDPGISKTRAQCLIIQSLVSEATCYLFRRPANLQLSDHMPT